MTADTAEAPVMARAAVMNCGMRTIFAVLLLVLVEVLLVKTIEEWGMF